MPRTDVSVRGFFMPISFMHFVCYKITRKQRESYIQKHFTPSGAGRYALASAAGFCVTIGLGLWMAEMIAVNFVAEEKLAAQDYEINPKIIDFDPPRARTKLKLYKTVEVPPPPARLSHQVTARPDEGGRMIIIDTPTFEVPVLVPTIFKIYS